MAETLYNVAKASFLRADIDLESANVRALLLTGAVTIDPDDATVADVLASNTEASDVSYGRVALTNLVVSQDDVNDRAQFDAGDIDFGALDNETPTAMLLFVQVTNDADSIPISIHDSNFGSPANGAGYVVETPNGLLRLS